MKIALGTFARSSIETHMGGDVTAGVQVALRHYARRLSSGWKPPDFPSFRREASLRRSDTALELTVDPEVEEALEREARACSGVSVEQLAAHAVLVYLADMDRDDTPKIEPRPLVYV